MPLLVSSQQIVASLILVYASVLRRADSFAPQCSSIIRYCWKDDGTLTSSLCASSISGAKSTMPTPAQSKHTCAICEASFPSKNALFRHLREDNECRHKSVFHEQEAQQQLVTARLALLVGYDYNNPFTDADEKVQDDLSKISFSFQEALDHALRIQYNSTRVKITSTSQSSVAKQRPRALCQDPFCSAAGDVLTINYKAPIRSSKQIQMDTEQIVAHSNEYLSEHLSSRVESAYILSCKALKADSTLNAEGDCTQKIYHYLLPLSWFTDGEEVAEWWLDTQNGRNIANNDESNHNNGTSFGSPPPNPTLTQIKKALRTAESPLYLNRKVRRRMMKEAAENESNGKNSFDKAADMRRPASRDGVTAKRERRPWHNFAAPYLAGEASPNQQICWKTLERARLVDIVCRNGELVLVVEFRGDDFVEQQIRRIIGSVVAIANCWLPENFMEMSTQPDLFIETPLAPPGRLYLSGVRFQGRGSDRLIWKDDSTSSKYQEEQLRNDMLDRLSDMNTIDKESKWLLDLRDLVSPRILQSMQGPTIEETFSIRTSLPPKEYEKVLELLRGIVSSNSWPGTSSARSKVIKERAIEATGSSGSFTVVNTGFKGDSSKIDVPQANVLFPELTAAIFELEEALASSLGFELDKKSLRPSSSHCAVNSRATFSPHVDSGRGAGQNSSMIVGLGNYGGGDLMIEGDNYDIRYQPLEFDGYTQRHWTSQFSGERFSLVWFTPRIE